MDRYVQVLCYFYGDCYFGGRGGQLKLNLSTTTKAVGPQAEKTQSAGKCPQQMQTAASAGNRVSALLLMKQCTVTDNHLKMQCFSCFSKSIRILLPWTRAYLYHFFLFRWQRRNSSIRWSGTRSVISSSFFHETGSFKSVKMRKLRLDSSMARQKMNCLEV